MSALVAQVEAIGAAATDPIYQYFVAQSQYRKPSRPILPQPSAQRHAAAANDSGNDLMLFVHCTPERFHQKLDALFTSFGAKLAISLPAQTTPKVVAAPPPATAVVVTSNETQATKKMSVKNSSGSKRKEQAQQNGDSVVAEAPLASADIEAMRKKMASVAPIERARLLEQLLSENDLSAIRKVKTTKKKAVKKAVAEESESSDSLATPFWAISDLEISEAEEAEEADDGDDGDDINDDDEDDLGSSDSDDMGYDDDDDDSVSRRKKRRKRARAASGNAQKRSRASASNANDPIKKIKAEQAAMKKQLAEEMKDEDCVARRTLVIRRFTEVATCSLFQRLQAELRGQPPAFSFIQQLRRDDDVDANEHVRDLKWALMQVDLETENILQLSKTAMPVEMQIMCDFVSGADRVIDLGSPASSGDENVNDDAAATTTIEAEQPQLQCAVLRKPFESQYLSTMEAVRVAFNGTKTTSQMLVRKPLVALVTAIWVLVNRVLICENKVLERLQQKNAASKTRKQWVELILAEESRVAVPKVFYSQLHNAFLKVSTSTITLTATKTLRPTATAQKTKVVVAPEPVDEDENDGEPVDED